MLNRTETTYFYLYRNSKGVLGQTISKFIGGESKLKENLGKQGFYVEKIYNIDKFNTKARSTYWSRTKLLDFTKSFKLELEKGNASGLMSERGAIRGIMKYIFDPVIYAIHIDIENGGQFKEAIKNFPNIFDDVYVGIVEGFFGGKFNPIEGLEIIENNIKENQEYQKSFITKSITYLGAIALGIIMSFVLDIQIYDSLVEEYATYGKLVPDFTTFYHELIWNIFYFGPIILIFILAGVYLLKNTRAKNIKIEFSKFILGFPIIGEIIRNKTMYDFVNIYYLLKSSKSILPRQILLITANSLPSFYVKEIFLEIYEEVREGKHIGEEMEEYDFFNNEEDTVKVFKGNLENEFELKSLQSILKRRFDDVISKSFAKLIAFILFFAVAIVLSIAYAYLMPLQQKTGLIKQQLNEQKMEQYLESKNK